jgi:hypothetical protein
VLTGTLCCSLYAVEAATPKTCESDPCADENAVCRPGTGTDDRTCVCYRVTLATQPPLAAALVGAAMQYERTAYTYSADTALSCATCALYIDASFFTEQGTCSKHDVSGLVPMRVLHLKPLSKHRNNTHSSCNVAVSLLMFAVAEPILKTCENDPCPDKNAVCRPGTGADDRTCVCKLGYTGDATIAGGCRGGCSHSTRTRRRHCSVVRYLCTLLCVDVTCACLTFMRRWFRCDCGRTSDDVCSLLMLGN